MKQLFASALAVTVVVGTADLLESAQARKLLVIGGGSEKGVYYQVAVNVCKLVNEKLGGQGYDCKGQPALGSVVNIKAMSQGYLDFAGNLDFCITIRTVVIEKGRAFVQAGAGIVADSNPAAEYEETRDKAKAVIRALELAQAGLS